MNKSFLINPNIILGYPTKKNDFKFFIKKILYYFFYYIIWMNIKILKPKKIYCNVEIYRKLKIKNNIKIILLDENIIKKREKINFQTIRNNLKKIYDNKKNLEKYESFFTTKFYEKKWLDEFFTSVLVNYDQINLKENLYYFSITELEGYLISKKKKFKKCLFFSISNFICKIFLKNRNIKKKIDFLATLMKKNSYNYKIEKKFNSKKKKIILFYCRIERDFEKLIPIINYSKNFFFYIILDDLDKLRFNKNFIKNLRNHLSSDNYKVCLASSLIKKNDINFDINNLKYSTDDMMEDYVYYIYSKFHNLTFDYLKSLNTLFDNLKPNIYISFNETNFSSAICHIANNRGIKSVYYHLNSPDAKTSLFETEFKYLLSPGKEVLKNMKKRFKNKSKKIVGVPMNFGISNNFDEKTAFLKKNKLNSKTKIIGFYSKKMAPPYTNDDLRSFFYLIVKNLEPNTKILFRQHPLVDFNILQDYLTIFKDKIIIDKDYSLEQSINLCDTVCSFTSTVLWPVMLKKKPIITFLRKDLISSYNFHFNLKKSCLNLKNSKDIKLDLQRVLKKSQLRRLMIKNAFAVAKSHFSYTHTASLKKINNFITNNI